MQKIHKINQYIIYFILIIDMCNGFMLTKGVGLPISQIFKGLFTILLFLGLINFSEGKACIWLLLLLFFSILPNLENLFLGNSSNFFLQIIHSQKFLFSVLVYFYYYEAFKRNIKADLGTFIKYSAIIIAINIILTYLGYGFAAYSNGVGATGFFFSGNELSFTSLLVFSFYLYYLNIPPSINIRYYLGTLLILIFSFLLGMKIVILGVLLVIAYFFTKLKNTLIKGLIILIILALVVIRYNLITLISPLFELWTFRWNNSDSFINFILSNRDKYLIEQLGIFLNSNPVQIIFGTGQSLTVEMDFFDILFNYGFTGILIIYGFYLFVYKDISKRCPDETMNFAYFINSIVLIGSAVAGHFIFSAMAGFYFSYLNSRLLTIGFSK